MLRQLRHDDIDCICHDGQRGHRYVDRWGEWHSATFETLAENRQYAVKVARLAGVAEGRAQRYGEAIVALLT